MYNILKLKIKSICRTVTKEIIRTLGIMILGFIFIIAILSIKYKAIYEVKIDGEVLGFVEDKQEFKTKIDEEILNKQGKNIESISLNEEPEYEIKLISRNKKTNEEEVIAKLNENTTTTYKYYAVVLNNKNKTFVDTVEEAEKVVEEIKTEYEGNKLELNLSIDEKYTQKLEEVKVDTVKSAELTVEEEVKQLIAEKEKKEAEEKAKNAIATVNGINISVLPVSGTITSRFGVSSSIRSGAHTGLDIACSKGTDIKVVADGEVIFAQRNGAYGNLVKVDHGNGVETWYAHCSKIYAKVGQKVSSGTVIAAVGSTGNSTGPHLHLEIRIEGTAVNPQRYLYKK